MKFELNANLRVFNSLIALRYLTKQGTYEISSNADSIENTETVLKL